MRHIISILLQNEAGALVRVANLFSSRGYNIESLCVAPTDDAAVSRLTLVTTGSDSVIQQINAQLRKLIDVVDSEDLTDGDHFERELLLLKCRAAEIDAISRIADSVGARLIDDNPGTATLELTATAEAIDKFIADVAASATILEVVRSGVAAVSHGERVLALEPR